MKTARNLVGQQFGDLAVLRLLERKGKRRYWECRCSCPFQTIVKVESRLLTRGRKTHCGCMRRCKHYSKINLKSFGRLFALGYVAGRNGRRGLWACICQCSGRFVFVPSDALLS